MDFKSDPRKGIDSIYRKEVFESFRNQKKLPKSTLNIGYISILIFSFFLFLLAFCAKLRPFDSY